MSIRSCMPVRPHNNKFSPVPMHSASARFNTISLFTAMVLAVACVANFFHGYHLYQPTAQVELGVDSIINFIKTPHWDQISFKYSLSANLSSLYNWNVKQLFAYVQFEWTDQTSNLTSRATGADWILTIPEDKSELPEKWVIEVKDGRLDYLIRDVHFGLRGNTVKISLNVEYMPIVGYFFKTRLHEIEYKMPEQYTNAR